MCFSVRMFDRTQRYRSHHKKCEEHYVKFQASQAEREHLQIHHLQFQKVHLDLSETMSE